MIHFNKDNITVFQSSLYMTTSAIIQDDDVVIMTDPNWLPHEVEDIRKHITEIIGDKQLYIIYTHSDFDHIIGAGAFPEAIVIAGEKFDNNPNKEEIVQEIYMFDQEYYLTRDYKLEYPAVDIVIINNEQKLELGSMTLTFYNAPGHTDDSLFTVLEPRGIFLAGDYLSDVEFPFIASNYNDYVNTISTAENIMLNHNITTLIPGHGSVTENHEEMMRRVNSSKYYLNQLSFENVDLEDYLNNEYKFFDGMKNIHYENREIANREQQESRRTDTK